MKKQTLITNNLNEIYLNIKSVPSYSSKIADFLRKNKTSSIFRNVRRKFPRRRVKSYFPFEVVMSDTINYRQYANSNRHYKYIMIVIDVFSKKAWAEPLKSLKDFDSAISLEKIFKSMPDMPHSLVTDRGLEYYNSKCKNLFERFGIKHYSIRGPHKACVAERFIRTLKGRLEKYFWNTKRFNWADILSQFIDNYNGTYHRTIKMAPNEVNDENRKKVFQTLYPNVTDTAIPRLQKGDRVRILKPKSIFEKGYTRSWSEELYIITNCFTTAGVDYYKITDIAGNLLPRTKYYWELNLVASANDN